MTAPLTPSQPPTPTRLRRTALLAVGAAVLLTLIVAAVTLVRSGTPAPRAAAPPEPAADRPAEPGFLEQPPRDRDEQALRELLAHPPALPPSSGPDEEALAGDAGEDLSSGPADSASPPQQPPDPRAEALGRALRAPLVPAGAAGSAAAPRLSPEESLAQAVAHVPTPAELRALLSPSPMAPALPDPGSAAAGLPPTSFHALGPQGPSGTAAPRIDYAVDPPAGPYRLRAGTVLPAVLLTAVDSSLPGTVVAQVSRDVYDSVTQSHLLLPRGSRLVGRYENQVALGQDRLLVAWDRLLLPDGTGLSLPGLPSSSSAGEAGLKGSVDNHTARIFGNAILLSLLSAGVQLSQPQQSAVAGQAPSAGQTAAGALGQELGTVAVEMVRRNLDVRPTIRLRSGLELNVLLAADLDLPGPAGLRP